MHQQLAVRIVPREERLERQRKLRAGALKSLTEEPTKSAVIQAGEPAESPEQQRMRAWVERQRALYPLPPPQSSMDAVREDLPNPPTKRVPVELIQHVVAQDYGISCEDMSSDNRHSDIVFPRQVAMYLAAEMARLSLPEIGRRFGGKNHATVLHSKAKIAWMIGKRDKVYTCIRHMDLSQEVDTELAGRVERLKQAIEDMWVARQRLTPD